MRRILFEQTDFAQFSNPPSGFNYIGFNGLTFSQKDHLGDTTETGGGGGTSQLIGVTASEIVDLIIADGITEGARYLITGVDPDLFGGTDVIVTGLSSNQITFDGWGKFYNPKYYSIGVWDSESEYNTDDLVIYGGKVWKNLTGVTGNSEGIFLLDGTNWELQEDYNNTDHYAQVWDKVELGFDGPNIYIKSRNDLYRNNYVRIGTYSGDKWFNCGVNPLSVFGWGNDNITNCNIVDSYFNCFNVMGSTEIYGVQMSNYSYLFDTTLKNTIVESLSFNNESGCYTLIMNDCNFKNCNFTNNSHMTGEFYNTTVEYIDLTNMSYLDNLHIYYSNFNYINLENNSYINYVSATNSSNFQRVNLSNESWISDIDLSLSDFKYINSENNSYINYITASSSYFQNINLDNESWISYIELTIGGGANSYFQRVNLSNRSYLYNVDLYDSTMYEINLDNYSYMEGSPVIDIWNSSMNYISLDNHSRIQGNIGLTNSSYFKRVNMTNRSRIQGNSHFDNSFIEKIDLTNDSYFYNLQFYNSQLYQLLCNTAIVSNLDFSDSGFGYSTVDESVFDYLTLGLTASGDGSYISGVKSFNSYVNGINYNNLSLDYLNLDRAQLSYLSGQDLELNQLDVSGSYLNFTALGTQSNTFPNGTSFKFNELKYQFDLTFDGTEGYGLTDSTLNIPSMWCPNDFYIEKIIIESSSLIYSGDSATFSFGFPGLSPSQVELLVSDISNKISVRDLSNGLLDAIKADSDKVLTCFLTGGTNVTSGGIKVEVTLKGTKNYYY